MKTLRYILPIVVVIAVMAGCKKDEPLPHNPYDDINYGDTLPPADTLDPNSITGLHRNIFSVKCAMPGCHDGSFEPDYRTVQSTYRTLVYHPLIKTDSTGYFKYRVKPYDVEHSWLHERLVTEDPVLGRMPLYDEPLSDAEMNQINTWIMNGAPNEDGSLPALPNEEPVIVGYLCLNSNNVQVDTNRVDDIPYNPFILAPNTTYTLAFTMTDDSTTIGALQNVKVKFNTQMNGFPNAPTTLTGTFLNLGQFQIWYVTINTANFPAGPNYFRIYCNDGDHVNDTEFPRNEQLDPYKMYYSFVVQ